MNSDAASVGAERTISAGDPVEAGVEAEGKRPVEAILHPQASVPAQIEIPVPAWKSPSLELRSLRNLTRDQGPAEWRLPAKKLAHGCEDFGRQRGAGSHSVDWRSAAGRITHWFLRALITCKSNGYRQRAKGFSPCFATIDLERLFRSRNNPVS
jgi:hypothetical protein